MKFFYILFFSLFIMTGSKAQDNASSEQPVYLRFPVIPQFTIYNAPDSSAFTRDNIDKRKPVVFFIFSPDCGHCKHETESILKNIKRFKNAQILMITHYPYDDMMNFYRHFKIGNHPQIRMGRDTKYFFPVFYKVENFPSIFVYDKKGNFKKSFEGNVKIDDIIAEL